MDNTKWLIVIDLDDTLIPTNYRYHLASLRAALIIQNELAWKSRRPLEVLAFQRTVDQALFKEMGFLVERYPTSWVKTYEHLAKEVGVAVDPAISQKIYNTAGHFRIGPFTAFKGVKVALRKLVKAGHRLHLVTAGEDGLQKRKVVSANLTRYFREDNFDVVPMEKKTIFRRLIETSDIPVMMVGDSKRNDIRPALELGMSTVWIPSETRNDTDSEVKPDYTIECFRLLPNLLPQIVPK